MMAEWVSTAYAAVGRDAGRLALALEGCGEAVENDFGRAFIGNFFAGLGVYNASSDCRGVVLPVARVSAPWCPPCGMAGEGFRTEDGGLVLRFSTITAWRRSLGFEEVVREFFPDLRLYYVSDTGEEWDPRHIVEKKDVDTEE